MRVRIVGERLLHLAEHLAPQPQKGRRRRRPSRLALEFMVAARVAGVRGDGEAQHLEGDGHIAVRLPADEVGCGPVGGGFEDQVGVLIVADIAQNSFVELGGDIGQRLRLDQPTEHRRREARRQAC